MQTQHTCYKRCIWVSCYLFFVIALLLPISNTYSSINDEEASNRSKSQTGSFDANNFTGAFTYSYPIQIAPARNGSEPKVSLSYSSSGGNSWCGVGWNLDFGFITRDTKEGVPIKWNTSTGQSEQQYDDSKGFVASIGGSYVKLISIGNDTYRAEIDSEGMEFQFHRTSGQNYWEVTDKAGNRYFFGESIAARQENDRFTSSSATEDLRTFKWSLSRVRDVKGNESYYTYVKESNTMYIDEIKYNANVNSVSLPATHRVKFTLENRPDILLNYSTGFKIQTNKRLTQVSSYIDQENQPSRLVTKYQFDYSNTSSTGRSQLISITQYGTDGISTLPPVGFSYSDVNKSFDQIINWGPKDTQGQNSQTWATVHEGVSSGQVTTLRDINGDGLPDRIMRKASGSKTSWRVQLCTGMQSDGTYGFASAINWTGIQHPGTSVGDAGYCTTATNNYGTHTDLMDVNGDSLPDRVMVASGGYTNPFKVQLNNGSGFDPVIEWEGAYHQSNDQNWFTLHEGASNGQVVSLRDINGDGLPDRVMYRKSGDKTVWIVQFCTGMQSNGKYGFSNPVDWPGIQHPGSSVGDAGYRIVAINNYGTHTDLIDVNSDGLPDRVMLAGGGIAKPFLVQFNNGRGFDPAINWGPKDIQGQSNQSWATIHESVSNGQVVTIRDINGDGLPDRIMRKPSGSKTSWRVQLCTGMQSDGTYGFSSAVNWTGIQHPGTSVGDAGYCTTAANNYGTHIDFMDINGDGLPDRVMLSNGSYTKPFKVQFNSGIKPDLLLSINNGIGGIIDVNYTTSASFDNKDDQGISQLRHSTYVVDSIKLSGALGWESTTQYKYSGGVFDYKKKSFAGFQRVETIDPSGSRKVVYYHQNGGRNDSLNGEYQDDGAFGKQGIPYCTEIYGSDNSLYTRTINKIDEIQLHPNGIYFPYIAQTINMEYEGDANYRATCTAFVYDTANSDFTLRNNLLTQIEYGEISSVNIPNHTFTDINNDDVYTHFEYITLSNPYIKGKISKIKITNDLAGTQILRKTQFTFNNNGQITTHALWLNTDDRFITNTFEYDIYGNLVKEISPTGVEKFTSYDSIYQMFPESVQMGGNNLPRTFTSYTKWDDRSGSPIWSVEIDGMVTRYEYDMFYRDIATYISSTSYSFIDNPILDNWDPTAIANLWRTKKEYHINGISNNASSNYIITRKFDPNDTVNGHVTYTYFDGFERTIQTRTEAETDASGDFRVTDIAYDSSGQSSSQTISYFSNGSQYTPVINATPKISSEYDAIGRKWKITPPVGDTGSPTGPEQVLYKHNADPWITVAIDSAGKIKRSVHDGWGRTTKIVEVNGSNEYDTIYEYDKLGNVIKITDNEGNITQFTRDSLGRKTQLSDPDTGITTYTYDDDGALISTTNARGIKTINSYDLRGQTTSLKDPLGRVITIRTVDNSNVELGKIDYYYDTQIQADHHTWIGKISAIIYNDGKVIYDYDNRGRPYKKYRSFSINANDPNIELSVERVYDDADRIIELKYPNNIATLEYSYDTAGHLRKVESTSGTTTNEIFYETNSFDAQGQMTSFDYGNGLSTNYEFYTGSKRLKRMQTTANTSGYLQDLQYTYDTASNIKSITDSIYSASASSTISNLQYDDLHRLTSINSVANGSHSFSYTSIGNMITNTENGTNPYTYSTSKPHAVTAANGNSYSYDASGNMITRNTKTLTYDHRNRLVKVKHGLTPDQGYTTFGYTEGVDRLWKYRYVFSGVETKIWFEGIYEQKSESTDGENFETKTLCHVIADGKRIATFEPDTSLLTANHNSFALATTNILLWPLRPGRAIWTGFGCIAAMILALSWLPNRRKNKYSNKEYSPAYEFVLNALRFTGRPWMKTIVLMLVFSISMAGMPLRAIAAVGVAEYDPVFYYYHQDHLGSASLLTDRDGDIVQHYGYGAYGKETYKNNTAAYNLSNRYTDQVFDEDTGLYYYNSRYYDPELGRFIQPDSIVPKTDDPQTLNRYSYVNNNPFKYVDPTGHFIIEAIVIGAIVGGLSAAYSGENILMGMAVGAVGALFMGLGAAGAGMFSSNIIAQTLCKVAASVASGTITAAIQGRDIGRAALHSALTAGIDLIDSRIGNLADQTQNAKEIVKIFGLPVRQVEQFALQQVRGILQGGVDSLANGESVLTGFKNAAKSSWKSALSSITKSIDEKLNLKFNKNINFADYSDSNSSISKGPLGIYRKLETKINSAVGLSLNINASLSSFVDCVVEESVGPRDVFNSFYSLKASANISVKQTKTVGIEGYEHYGLGVINQSENNFSREVSATLQGNSFSHSLPRF
ncbi:tRNA(Glu)-specific nuclease WapA precursor [Poriferisphaera corsica]|uniref:tRNA(Glu)-specific nuclease WapA n=1 Tax=Poriferisphaera corsica TaxID=2528020 RepID=A0A517YVE9_9BACT|nr:RHS repeat-associated core domain-containing protein [Poriferisphaera corsica]QDU34187.1 tRNA(Glu)-specific nuclease WapA precursor [Poriferisphaera corsica]